LAEKYKVVVVSHAAKSKKFDPSYILNAKTGDEFKSTVNLLSGRSVPISAYLTNDPFAVDELIQFDLEAEMREFLKPLDVVFVSQSEKVCPGAVCFPTTKDGKPKYKDNSHMRPFFVEKYIDSLDPYVRLSK